MGLPQIKKKISSFLLGEEGQISKKVVVGLGVVLAGVAVETAKAYHCQSTSTTSTTSTTSGECHGDCGTTSTTSTTSTTGTTACFNDCTCGPGVMDCPQECSDCHTTSSVCGAHTVS